MLQASLLASATSALVLAAAILFPHYYHKSYHFPRAAGAQQHPPLHPHLCERIPELAHCDDIALHKPSGRAYFACDDTRLWRDPLRLRGSNSIPANRKGGAIWHLDLNDAFSLPVKLDIAHQPPGFHPAGITLTTVNSTQHNDSSPDAIMLLVANYPGPAGHPGVVDVLVHNLTQSTANGATTLRHHRRLDHTHFHANWRGSTPSISRAQPIEERTAGAQLSPWRLTAFLEQYSPPLPPDAPRTGPDLAIPSFFFSSAPVAPGPQPNLSRLQEGHGFDYLAPPSALDAALDMLLPAHPSRAHIAALRPPAHIYTYIANGAVSVPASDGSVAFSSNALGSAGARARTMPGFPPIPRAWDGGGERAGRNNSAASLLVLGTTGSRSGVAEHEQHWVRSIPSVVRIFGQMPAYSSAKRLHRGRGGAGGGEDAVAMWGEREVVAVYTPQFVTFVTQNFAHLQTAMAHDVYGRYWTAGPEGGLEVARTWLAHLYAVSTRTGGAHADADASAVNAPKRPVTAIYQTTHLYRHGPSVAHPWELDRLKVPRDAGIFLPKEFYTTPVFRGLGAPPAAAAAAAGRGDAVGAFEPLAIQPAPGGSAYAGAGASAYANSSTGGKVGGGPVKAAKQMGFLPTLPTGLEVDHERGWVLVSSVWDERGAARCEIPTKWAER